MNVGSFIRVAFMLAALVATLLQMVIDSSSENITAAAIVLASSLSILLYMHWSSALRTHPLSVFVIFGFCLTTQLGALLVQTAYWTPLRFNLYDARYTFGTLAFYQGIALAVHAVYCIFTAKPASRDSFMRGILRTACLYETPPPAALWVMGAIGLAGWIAIANSGVLGKIGRGIEFLAWAPFLIPFYRSSLLGRSPISQRFLTVIVIYAACLALIAIATNGREAIFRGLLTVSLLLLLQGLRSERPIQARSLAKCGVLTVVGVIALQPSSELVAAMGAARAYRSKASPLEMVTKTYDLLRHPELIRDARENEYTSSGYRTAYDEIYLRNSLFGRFVETKFHDNSLHFAESIVSDDSRQRLRSLTIDSMLAVLPVPFLRALDINVDKSNLQFSMGDYLFYLARGGGLGNFKTGSAFGEGVALLGSLFPIVYAAACLAIFHWLRLMTSLRTGASSLSPMAMMNIWVLFKYGITAESISAIFSSIVREFPQWICIYLIALFMSRFLLGGRYIQTADRISPGSSTC